MNKWRTYALPLALILPVILLAGQWVQARGDAAKGVIWNIPVTGYDPHDMLRGHYVMLGYQWPGLADDAYPQGLCIQGTKPIIDSVAELRHQENGDPVTANCAAFVLSKGGYGMPDPMRVARYYTNREAAQRIEKALFSGQRGVLTARIRPDGEIVPVRLTLLPKAGSKPDPTP